MRSIDFYETETRKRTGQDAVLLPRERTALAMIKNRCRGDSIVRFLDSGCNCGSFLQAVSTELGGHEKVKCFGLDYSKSAIQIAKGLAHDIRWCNLEDGIPFGNASFDFVYAGELIEHLYDPDSFLDECHRVIAEKGCLLITTPNIQAWYNRILFPLGIMPIFYETSTRSTMIGAGVLRRLKSDGIPVGHLRLFNKTALCDILSYHGFRTEVLAGTTFPSLPRFMAPIDKIFNRITSLSSGFVALAEKVSK